MELEEAINRLEDLKLIYEQQSILMSKYKDSYLLNKQAIETVLKEIEYIKNDKEKAMEILRENSIGKYKRDVNGIETYIIVVEDFKKILNLIDTQEIKLKNSIPKKKIEDKIIYWNKRLNEDERLDWILRDKSIINELQELLEDK